MRRLGVIAGVAMLVGASHGQTPVLQTGGVSTNVVAVFKQPAITKPNSHVTVSLAWRAMEAHGFGIIKFSQDDRFEDAGPSLLITASGYRKMMRPGEAPGLADLSGTLDGEGLYTLHFRAYLGVNGVSLVGDIDTDTFWPGVALTQKDFQSSQVVLCGKGLEIVSLSHTTTSTGTLLLVR